MALSLVLLQQLSKGDAAQLEENVQLRRVLAYLDSYHATVVKEPLYPDELRAFIRVLNLQLLEEEGKRVWRIQVLGENSTQLVVYYKNDCRDDTSISIERLELQSLKA